MQNDSNYLNLKLWLRVCFWETQTKTGAAQVVQTVKNLSAMQEMWVQSLGWENPLEKGMATLQYSCLENSMVRGTWRNIVHGVAKSWI